MVEFVIAIVKLPVIIIANGVVSNACKTVETGSSLIFSHSHRKTYGAHARIRCPTRMSSNFFTWVTNIDFDITTGHYPMAIVESSACLDLATGRNQRYCHLVFNNGNWVMDSVVPITISFFTIGR